MQRRQGISNTWRAGAFLALTLCATLTWGAGLLQPIDGSLPPLEIEEHRVEVVLEDGYAITKVEQVFRNPHNRDLEAQYSFPVPEHGSVAEFTLWIDGNPVTGEVLERKQARQVYEEEKAAGRDAGVTEKDGYKTFEVRVFPVRPGVDTRVRLVYLQPVRVDAGIGRYVYPLEEGGVDEQKLAFWTANEKVMGRFGFDLQIKSSYPVDAVRVPNQPSAQIQQHGAGEWKVHLSHGGGRGNAGVQSTAGAVAAELERESTEAQVLAATTASGGVALEPEQGPTGVQSPGASAGAMGAAFKLDHDLVVYWRHAPDLPGSVDLVAHKPGGQKRGTFMLVVTPGDDLQPITEGRDWVFVLDMSGSMRGKYATLADGVQRALEKMRPDDRFRIVLFNNRSRELTSGFVEASAENVARYSQDVAVISPGGSTNLYAGIQKGLKSLHADRTSALVLVTDGVANVGETAQRKFIELIERKDIRLFTMIMGNSANRPLLEAITKASNGFALSISNSDDVVGQLLAATSKVSHQALHGVKLDIDGVKTGDLTPQTIGSLYRGQQLVVFGHYWGDGVADVELTGRISGEKKVYRTQFPFPRAADENPEIERLWAYARIEEAIEEIDNFGEEPDLKQAVVDLGVEYGLVTDYTAMLVVRDEVFERRGIKRSNRARLALEHAAQQQRAQRSAVSRRVDTQQPMYTSKRASHSGGGALDVWSLLLLLPLVWLLWQSRRWAHTA